MNKHRSSLVLTFVLICTAITYGQTAADDWKTKLDSMIEQGVAAQHVPGLAVGIVRDGRLEYARGFGSMKMGQAGSHVTPNTLFHMASVTKPFAATAIMQLVEDKKIDLDAPLTTYLSYFKMADPRYTKITIREMLTHTSGMPDVQDYEWNKPQLDDDALEHYVRSLSGEKLLWDPGTRFAYSNMAFEVLGDVIAKISGETFEDYVARHILEPVGMTSSTLLLKKADPALLAAGYTKTKDSPELVPVPAYPFNRAHAPSSNLMSNVNDMARWAMVNMNRGELDGKRILKESTYDILWKPAAEVEFCRGGPCRKPGSSVGMSWFLERKDGYQVVSHGGGDDGFITSFIMIPDRKFAFIMMTNSDSAGIPLLKQIQSEAMALALTK